jgi:hypothetical protein
MKNLQKFWWTQAPVDREHKQYILLDFLKSVKDDFTFDILYPWLTEVRKQHKDLTMFKHERDEILKKFRRVKGLNMETESLEYETDAPWVTGDFEEVSEIVDFSIPRFHHWMEKGQDFFDEVRLQMKWDVVGLVPEYRDEGYFILHVDSRDLTVYRFKVEKIILDGMDFVGLTMDVVETMATRICNYDGMKHDMIKKHADLPFPLTFSVQSRGYPMDETLLPVMKRVGLVKIKKDF